MAGMVIPFFGGLGLLAGEDRHAELDEALVPVGGGRLRRCG
jgi:hypothetical protein